MSKHLYWLDDASWLAIEPLLPRGRRGARRVDDRRVISGIMHMLKTGARWRDCPAEYGPYTSRFLKGIHRVVMQQSGAGMHVRCTLAGLSDSQYSLTPLTVIRLMCIVKLTMERC
jgi:transposase